MKKTMIAATLALMAMVGCNNDANDGDATTDTTNFDRGVPQSAAPYGDTARDVSNEGTRTDLNVRTDVDSASQNRRADSAGGINNGGRNGGGN